MACHPVQVRLQQSLAAGPEQLSLYEQTALQCDAEVAAMSEGERRTTLNIVLQQQVSPALNIDHAGSTAQVCTALNRRHRCYAAAAECAGLMRAQAAHAAECCSPTPGGRVKLRVVKAAKARTGRRDSSVLEPDWELHHL